MNRVVAVAGATGLVGREMLKVLEDRKFPTKDVRAFASASSAGKKIPFRGGEVTVRELKEDSFQGVDIALFALKAPLARRFAPAAAKSGATVIDNSSAFRMDPEVPLVVPEVNAETVWKHKGIIANPNCSTIQMVVALAPLHRAARVKRLIVATYQAVSGGGAAAMEELRAQVPLAMEGRELVPSAFPHPIAFNAFPHIGDFGENGYTTEEMKMVNETRKILGDPGILVSATCVRIPVFRAHSEAAHVEFEKKLTAAEARALLKKAPGVVVLDDPANKVYPMPLFAAGKYEVFVGRIREDLTCPNGLELWVVADQILKGAALNAVQIAELLIDRIPQRKK
jgi:aspartate-semialdehyde dehydrogenase